MKKTATKCPAKVVVFCFFLAHLLQSSPMPEGPGAWRGSVWVAAPLADDGEKSDI